ncbi:hypothetical protein MTO96_044237 [Rhipicephalus appendiculatus]
MHRVHQQTSIGLFRPGAIDFQPMHALVDGQRSHQHPPCLMGNISETCVSEAQLEIPERFRARNALSNHGAHLGIPLQKKPQRSHVAVGRLQGERGEQLGVPVEHVHV